MELGVTEMLMGSTGLLLGVYYFLTCNYNFWKERGVPGPKPVLVFGTISDIIFGRLSIGSYLEKIYKEYPDEPMVGIYTRRQPVLVLNDMELIKQMLIKDFKSFMDRGLTFRAEKTEPLTAHLFNIEAKRWRPLRTKLTPVFTSGKLREMFYLLIQCSDQLGVYLDQVKNESIDIREVSAKFTTDVIGVCAFGLQANALADENSLFREMGKRIFDMKLKNVIRFRLRTFVPFLYDLIGRFFVDYEVNDFFINITRDTMKFRKENNILRHDFIDLLAALKDDPSKIDDLELTDELLAAQLFVFFVAGFETSSSTMSNCFRELALNQPVQEKLRREIKEVLDKTEDVITYDAIKNMKYLDQVVSETLRKYPPVTSIMRKTTTPYTFPGTKVSIPTGTPVWVPIFGIQRDPKYFPDPDAFDPERFSEENIKSRPAMSYIPFGEGPRNCIGARFGQMQTRVGIVKVLQKYRIDVCEQTDEKYEINQLTFLLAPKNGIFVKITED